MEGADEGGDPFWTKLERQLGGADPAVIQLMAEMLFRGLLGARQVEGAHGNQEETDQPGVGLVVPAGRSTRSSSTVRWTVLVAPYWADSGLSGSSSWSGSSAAGRIRALSSVRTCSVTLGPSRR